MSTTPASKTGEKPVEFNCRVAAFREITPTVFEVEFTPDPIVTPEGTRELNFKAGQFISVIVPNVGPGGRGLRRAYSIASPPHQKKIELCVKLVENGPGTNFLFKLRPGDQFKGWAPYGTFVYSPKHSRHVCFISTGTGIAPFRSMMQSEHYKQYLPVSTLCLFGCRDEEEILYQKELSALPYVIYVAAVSRPKNPNFNGFKGRVTDYLRELGPNGKPWKDMDFYLCGGSAMIDEVKSILTGYGVEKSAIHVEVYYKDPKNPA